MPEWLREAVQGVASFLNTNIGTFVAEIVLLGIIVPMYLSYSEARKWRPMRKELYFCFNDMFIKIRPILSDALKFDGREFDIAGFSQAYENLKSKVTILGACIDSSISANVTVILRSLDDLQTFLPGIQKAHNDYSAGLITKGELYNRRIRIDRGLLAIQSNFKQLRKTTSAIGRPKYDLNAPEPEDYDLPLNSIRKRLIEVMGPVD